MRALFLDRDGVINVDVGYGYRIDQMEFVPGIFEFTKKFSDAGYAIVVVTNQAGIGRGYYSEADFHTLTQWMVGQFAARGVTITAVKFCPHHPQATLPQYQVQCACRKPEPGMLNEAIAQFGIDATQSLMIGDRASDMLAGYNAHVGALFLLGDAEEWLNLDETIRARVTHITQFGDIKIAPER